MVGIGLNWEAKVSNELSMYRPTDLNEYGGAGVCQEAAEPRGRGAPGPVLKDAGKRALDVIGAALLLTIFLFAFLLIGLVLLVAHGRPVLYSHERVGRGGGAFGCLKFRTMHNDADRILNQELRSPEVLLEWEATGKLKRDPRVHKVGSFLRRSSLDELPQLLNVLAGSMSLVGPRPIVKRELAKYGNRVGCYLALRPGLTGLWQVSGRNDLTYTERVALDERYLHERSLWLDAKILLRTVNVVLLTKGAY